MVLFMVKENDRFFYKKTPSYKNLVRILGTNIDGDRQIVHGLSMVKGIGRRVADAAVRVAKIHHQTRAGSLTEEQINLLENILKNPTNHGIPVWMVNRAHDLRTGQNRHVSGTELDLINRQDVERMRALRSWKGVRHALGLKVNGQRTRCTGRRGLVVGYLRKKKGAAV